MGDSRLHDGVCWYRISHYNRAKESSLSYYQIQGSPPQGKYWAELSV